MRSQAEGWLVGRMSLTPFQRCAYDSWEAKEDEEGLLLKPE